MAAVIELFPVIDEADDENPLRHRTVDRKLCPGRCNRAELDQRDQRVYCRDCGREIPAWDELMKLAADPERYIAARKESARLARLADARLKELLRLERNAKSRLRRLEVPRAEVQKALFVAEREARSV